MNLDKKYNIGDVAKELCLAGLILFTVQNDTKKYKETTQI